MEIFFGSSIDRLFETLITQLGNSRWFTLSKIGSWAGSA